MDKIKNLKDLIIYMMTKKTRQFLIFLTVITTLIILLLRINITCEKKNGKWDFKINTSQLKKSLPFKKK